MKNIVIALDDVRSLHNVGSIFRTMAFFGYNQVICGGITPYPQLKNDTRLPHVIQKADKVLNKTALGAVDNLKTSHQSNLAEYLAGLKDAGFLIVCVEQVKSDKTYSPEGILEKLAPLDNIVIVFGNEPQGIAEVVVSLSDYFIEISGSGQKESLNVSVAAGVVLSSLSVLLN